MRIKNSLFLLLMLIVCAIHPLGKPIFAQTCTCDQPIVSGASVPTMCAISSNTCGSGFDAVCAGRPVSLNCVSAGCSCVAIQPSPTIDVSHDVCTCSSTGTIQSASCTQIPVCNATAPRYCSCQAPIPGVNCAGPGEPYDNTAGLFCCQGNPPSTSGTCPGGAPATTTPIRDVCESAGTRKAQCDACMFPGVGNTPGAWTALGCINANPQDFIPKLITFGIGIAGGIAFLLMLLGGFQVMTSAGNPEQLNGGKELIGAAITGLILIIFSVFLLRLIGYDILRIPGIT
jgi:hypothetical protein